MALRRRPDSLFEYRYEDFELLNYEYHPHIRAAVAV
jgi:thymidylate synthase